MKKILTLLIASFISLTSVASIKSSEKSIQFVPDGYFSGSYMKRKEAYYSQYKVVPEITCIDNDPVCLIIKENAELKKEIYKLRQDRFSLLKKNLYSAFDIIDLEYTIRDIQRKKEFSVKCPNGILPKSSFMQSILCKPNKELLNEIANIKTNGLKTVDQVVESLFKLDAIPPLVKN